MNQCLENPPDDEVSPERDALAAGRGAEAPRAAPGGAVSAKGRVLLIEDDPAFREIISDGLAENGYSVVAVQNSADGIRELLAGEITLVICDVTMPEMRGDTFYRAVEKVRPVLCQRFLFTTGRQTDAKTDNFIQSIGGTVLRKPFGMEELVGAITLAEVNSTFRSVFEFPAADPALPRSSTPAGDFPADGPALAEKVAVILARAEGEQAPEGPADLLPEMEPHLRASGASRAVMFFGWALLVALVAGLCVLYGKARAGIAAATAEIVALDAEWTALSPQLEEEAALRSKVEALHKQLAGITEDRTAPRWAPALRRVVACAGLEIEVLAVRAREENGETKMWTLRVSGISKATAPRIAADRYRLALEQELERLFHGGVSVRFEQFEDLPRAASALPDERRGSFKIVATIRFDGTTGTEGKEGG